MSDTDQTVTDPAVLELDDVEGHGLREVAAGLSAAAVLAGGGAAAFTAGTSAQHSPSTKLPTPLAASTSQAETFPPTPPIAPIAPVQVVLDKVHALQGNVRHDLKVIQHLPGDVRKVATVLSVVTTAAPDGVHTATVMLKAVHASSDAKTAGGWVLVKSGDQVLAQVKMIEGNALASWTQPHAGPHGVTLTYTGDDTFAPTVRALLL